MEIDAERWIKQLNLIEKVKQDLRAKEKAEAGEEERIRQEAESRAWLRELGRADDDSHGFLSMRVIKMGIRLMELKTDGSHYEFIVRESVMDNIAEVIMCDCSRELLKPVGASV
jgi:hypothetical protein